MPGTHHTTPAERMCLTAAARELHDQYRGVFGQETIQSLPGMIIPPYP
jgi:hypothetical protein